MVLPAPELDDRTFQDLVDDAKRLVQQRCPDWTDHNVSDPGVTLIEAYAQMVDQLIYRLNRVPERNYVKFLELIGVELRPPAAARGEVTFWLSAPQPQDVVVRAGTEVATPRTDIEMPVVFSTVDTLELVSCSLTAIGAQATGGQAVDHTDSLGESGFDCFEPTPGTGDALLIGLTKAVPSCAVLLRFECRVAGVGILAKNPPLQWEAWSGTGWDPCVVDRDETGGLNRSGDVVVHVPATHQVSVLARRPAGWLRCRVLDPVGPQRAYRESPHVLRLAASTIGGTTRIVNAEEVRDETFGPSDGSPGQRFALRRRPVVPWEEPSVLLVSGDDGWEEWTPVQHFAESGPASRHFRIDAFAGEVQFGPAVRRPDGTLQHFGAVPARGARLQLVSYRTGGGRRGNVGTGQVRVLKTSTPYVASVVNRAPAVGGADGESVQDAKVRGPVLLRSRGRAVTAEDFEQLAAEVAPDAARVHCVAAADAADANGVRLLVVPHLPTDPLGRVAREDLDPPPATLARITTHLDARRLIGTRLVVEPPRYRWLTVVVSASARHPRRAEDVRREVLAAIHEMLHPLRGGPDGTGWPFGRSVQSHEVAAHLARLPGVDMSRDLSVQLFPADAGGVTGRRGEPVTRLDLGPTELVYSYEHQVRVQPWGAVAGLVNPHPVGSRLPAIYHDDDVVQRWCSALDEGLAPVVSTLDCLPAYLDPATTPADMLEWLAGWIGVVLEPGQSEARRRELVAAGVGLSTWRGTAKGVRDAVHVLLGVVPVIEETGGSDWSATPGAPMPGSAGAVLTVRVEVPDVDAVDLRRLDDCVAAAKPAHVRHQLDVRGAP